MPFLKVQGYHTPNTEENQNNPVVGEGTSLLATSNGSAVSGVMARLRLETGKLKQHSRLLHVLVMDLHRI